MKKILSLIVPSYNMEKYLPKCLGSLIVAPELMEKLEVLVVNDGSKDRTSEISHEFAAKWPGTFKVIDKDNGHYGSCINASLPVFSGKYVRLLDADDTVDTRGFAAYVRRLEKTDVDLLLTDYVMVDRDDTLVEDRIQPFATGAVDRTVFLNRAFTSGWLPEMHGVTYHRSVFERFPDYRQTEGDAFTDAEWIVYPMSRVRNVECLHEHVYRYLVDRPGQSMDRKSLNAARPTYVYKRNQRFALSFSWSQTVASKAYADYYRRAFLQYLSGMYRGCILQGGTCSFPGGFSAFDLWMKDAAPLAYECLNALWISNRWKFHHVRAWRKHAFVSLALFKLYLKVSSALVRLYH